MAKLDDDLDALFKLPLAEFIGARKTLAARLKKDGRANEAEYVKSLAKPSISAWAVNQLYWNHRGPFEELLASGQRFHKAQTSGKVAEMRDALAARRDALVDLSNLASTLLRNAGHNPSMEGGRRINSTLEALSAYASLSGSPSDARPTPGHLTQDIDPPGFESFAGFIPSAGQTGSERPAAVTPSKKVASTFHKSKLKAPGTKDQAQSTKHKAQSSERVNRVEETRHARLAAAKLALQTAKKSLSMVRANAQSLESQQKKADAAMNEADKRQREALKENRLAEERLKKASSAAEDATRRARTIRNEVDEARARLADAQRTVDKATSELESLFRSTK